MKNMQVAPAKIIEPDLFLPRSLSQISRIYCGCAGFGQIFQSFSGNVEQGPQLRSQACWTAFLNIPRFR